MNIEGFLAKLGECKDAFPWFFEESKGKKMIRAYAKTGDKICPVIALANKEGNGEYGMGLGYLGLGLCGASDYLELEPQSLMEIVSAADDDVTQDMEVRKKLLTTVGLL